MILNDTAFFFFYFQKKGGRSYCITVLLSFPEAAIKSWKLQIHVLFTYIFKSFVLSLSSSESF